MVALAEWVYNPPVATFPLSGTPAAVPLPPPPPVPPVPGEVQPLPLPQPLPLQQNVEVVVGPQVVPPVVT